MSNSKTVLITGGSRGIGAAISLGFGLLGYNTVINYNKSEKKAYEILNNIKKVNKKVIAVKADVSKYKECKKLVETAIKFGGLDILVNNAGVSMVKLFQDVNEKEWKNLFNINLASMFNCTSFAIKHMINNKSGNIINISSIWGITGASMEVHYSASKAAVIGFTKSLAKEVGPSNITVNCIAPGVFETDMNNFNKEQKKKIKNEIPMNKFGKPSDVAKVAIFLAENSEFITGQVISPNGGMLI